MKGLIRRLPRSNTYMLTSDRVRFAVFYTKLGNRLLEPLMATSGPPAPVELRRALRVIDHTIDDAINRAHMKVAA